MVTPGHPNVAVVEHGKNSHIPDFFAWVGDELPFVPVESTHADIDVRRLHANDMNPQPRGRIGTMPEHWFLQSTAVYPIPALRPAALKTCFVLSSTPIIFGSNYSSVRNGGCDLQRPVEPARTWSQRAEGRPWA